MRRRALSVTFLVVVTAGLSFGAWTARHALASRWKRWAGPEAGAKEPAPTAAARAERAPDDGWCKEEDGAEAKPCPPPWPIIRLASAGVVKEIGIATGKSRSMRHVDHLSGNAEVSYATHNYAEIRPRVAGRIHAVPVDEGEIVKKGQVVAIVDAADVALAKSSYLTTLPMFDLAKANFDRQMPLARSGALPAKTEIEVRSEMSRAEAALMNAAQKLKNLGYSDKEIEKLAAAKDTSSLIEIIAPMSGTLVERHAVMGEAVEPATQLFAVTDLSEMWCWIDVYEDEIDRVKPGQKVSFTISGRDKPVFHGKVELVGFAVNPATRTVRVRAELENIDGLLLANQFGRAVIDIGQPHDAVVVPREAVQEAGNSSVVFLPLGDGRFLPRRVEAHPFEDPDLVEIPRGLEADQEVVTTGSFLLKSEMLKLGRGEG